MRRLIGAFVVRICHKQVFSWRGSLIVLPHVFGFLGESSNYCVRPLFESLTWVSLCADFEIVLTLMTHRVQEDLWDFTGQSSDIINLSDFTRPTIYLPDHSCFKIFIVSLKILHHIISKKSLLIFSLAFNSEKIKFCHLVCQNWASFKLILTDWLMYWLTDILIDRVCQSVSMSVWK